MKFIEPDFPVYSDDLYYDLIDGGYIRPEEMLADPADVSHVQNAILTVRQFLEEALEAGVLEPA